MHIIITDAWMAKSRPVHLSGLRLLLAGIALSIAIFIAGMALYRWVFLTGVQQGWPGFTTIANLTGQSDAHTKDRYVRENLDALAKRIGELQGKIAQIEVLSQRVAGLAGIAAKDIPPPLGKGGVLLEDKSFTVAQLDQLLNNLDQVSDTKNDYLTVVETTLFEQKLRKMMLPTQHPVANATLGSRFGWRIDPFTGRSALHAGLDFAGVQGTPIVAAAGGVVVTQEYQSAYGNVIEIDHGNDVVTRYAHMHTMLAKKGDLVKRGQKIGEIGSTGRSTGPHLHFEVSVQGQLQDPMRFLAAGDKASASSAIAHAKK